jgi:hypothetical protein
MTCKDVSDQFDYLAGFRTRLLRPGLAHLEPREPPVFLRLPVQFLSPLRLLGRGCSYRGFVLGAGLPDIPLRRTSTVYSGVLLPPIRIQSYQGFPVGTVCRGRYRYAIDPCRPVRDVRSRHKQT